MLEKSHTVESVCGFVLQNESSERHVQTKQTETLKVNMKDDNKVNRTISTQGPSWASLKSPIALCYLSRPRRDSISEKQVPKSSGVSCSPPEGRRRHVLRQEKMKMGLGHVSLLENKRVLCEILLKGEEREVI